MAMVNYFWGNHENWFTRAEQEDLKATNLYRMDRHINLRKYAISIIPYNETIHYGHLYYAHGTCVSANHAKQMATSYRRCLVYGHTHDRQSYMLHSPIDVKEKIMAKSIGCLCTLNADYMKGIPNKWVNCFHIAYVNKDGTFNDYDVNITSNRFTAPNGRTYK